MLYRDPGVWMSKLRATMFGMMGVQNRTIVNLDMDHFPAPGFDSIFPRIKEEITSAYPLPIGATHWMSKVPGADGYSVYAVPCDDEDMPCDPQVERHETCNPPGVCKNRPIRWTQALLNWSQHAFPFMLDMLFHRERDLKKNSVDDEHVLNFYLFKHNATKQFCRYLPNRFEYLEWSVGHIGGIGRNQDKVYFPDGIPTVMISFHGEKNHTIAAAALDAIKEAHVDVAENKLIVHQNKLYSKAQWLETDHMMDAPCLLPI